MVKVQFYQRDENTRNGKKRLNKRLGKYQFTHVFMQLDDGMNIDNCLDSEYIYSDELLKDHTVTTIELPVSSQFIYNKWKKNYRTCRRMANGNNFLRGYRERYNIQAIIGGGMMCSNMVAYLLGYEDYWRIDADDLYFRIKYGMEKPSEYLLELMQTHAQTKVYLDDLKALQTVDYFNAEFEDEECVKVEQANSDLPLVIKDGKVIDSEYRLAKLMRDDVLYCNVIYV